MKRNRLTLLTMALCASTALAACSSGPHMMEESSLHSGEIRLAEDRHVEKSTLREYNRAHLDDVAKAHLADGMGKVYIVLGYNHRAKTDGYKADKALKEMVARLLAAGEPDDAIVARSIPLDVPEPVVVVAYETLAAKAPAGCNGTPGLDAPVVMESGYDYKLGCGVKSLMAKQIEHPKELEGVAGLPSDNDAERAAAIVQRYYRPGETQAFLPGYVLSSVGSASQ